MKYVCNVCAEENYHGRQESCIVYTDEKYPPPCLYYHKQAKWIVDRSPDYRLTAETKLMPEEAQKVVNEHFDELIGEEK